MADPSVTPQRIQLRRTKGWRLPQGAVVVSRPSRWGNPWRVGSTVTDQDTQQTHQIDAAEAVTRYRQALTGPRPGMYGIRVTVEDVRRELAGKDLACWCKPGAPCHADVLLDLAAEG